MALEVPQAELKPQHAAPSVHGSSAGPSDDISVFDLLIILAERRRLISWITIVFACSAIIISLLLPKSYKATVTLLPPQQSSSIGASLVSQLGNMGGGMAALAGGSLGIKNPNDMFVAMLKSRTVEDAMVQRYDLQKEYRSRYLSDARKAFESHVTVDGSGKDTMIHISVEARDPNRAAELANGYVEQFRSLSEHLAITEASQRRLFFQKELEQAKNNLASAEEALKATQEKTGLIQLDSQSRALIESAATLRAEITAREVQIQGMQTYATSENAQLVQAQRELDGLRAQLSRLGGSGNGTDEFIVPKGKVPQAGIEYVRRVRDIKYNETIFEILARQFEVAKLDEAKQGALIQVVDPAIPPDRRSFPKRALIVIGATFVGLFVGIIVSLLQAGFRRLKEDPDTRDKLANLRRVFQRSKYL
jgi:tyrosine-protein kinase Etk/Wzc